MDLNLTEEVTAGNAMLTLISKIMKKMTFLVGVDLEGELSRCRIFFSLTSSKTGFAEAVFTKYETVLQEMSENLNIPLKEFVFNVLEIRTHFLNSERLHATDLNNVKNFKGLK